MHGNAAAIDQVAAFPAAVDQDQHDHTRYVHARRADEVRIVQPQDEIDELEHHRGDVSEHVLERVARGSELLVTDIIGKAGDRGERGHDQTDSQEPPRAGCPKSIRRPRVCDVSGKGENEADDREWYQHRMNRMIADLSRAVWMNMRAFSGHFSLLLPD